MDSPCPCGLSTDYPAQVEVISLRPDCTKDVSGHLQLHGLSVDTAVNSECKLLLARAGNNLVIRSDLEFPSDIDCWSKISLRITRISSGGGGGRGRGGGWGWGEMVLSTHIWAVNGFVTLNTVYFLPLEQGQFFQNP